MKKYTLTVRYVNFISMQVERQPMMTRHYRWKWIAKVHEFVINTAPRSFFGMLIANVEEEAK